MQILTAVMIVTIVLMQRRRSPVKLLEFPIYLLSVTINFQPIIFLIFHVHYMLLLFKRFSFAVLI